MEFTVVGIPVKLDLRHHSPLDEPMSPNEGERSRIWGRESSHEHKSSSAMNDDVSTDGDFIVDDDALERELMAEMTKTEDINYNGEREIPFLSKIPEDVVEIILRFLAPCELTCVASTCTALRAMCDADVLWLQCFKQRFGNDYTSTATKGVSWKAKYFAADRAEINRERSLAPKGFEDMFVEAAVAKRSQACLQLAPISTEMAESDRAISAWKRKRSFLCAENHRCSRRLGCTYHEVADKTFVCETSGLVHVCDENCRERTYDNESETEICEISGASFDTVLHEEEREDNAGEQQDQYFERGFFGRAFAVGYDCENETELQTALWGAPTPRNR